MTPISAREPSRHARKPEINRDGARRDFRIDRNEYTTLGVLEAIFHDIPRNGDQENTPLYSEAFSTLDADSKRLIHRRLKDTLTSRRSFAFRFRPDAHIVPAWVTQFLSTPLTENDSLIGLSRRFAERLLQAQKRQMSPGLLCVSACQFAGRKALALLKLEHTDGARLPFDQERKTFTMQALRDLVFTSRTRFFKAVLFARLGTRTNATGIDASDDQNGEMAIFWLDFIECEKLQDARVVTKIFFETVKGVINTHPGLTPEQRVNTAEALLVAMRDASAAVSVPQFLEDHRLPPEVQRVIKARLRDAGIDDHFDKDVSEIASELRSEVYHTDLGFRIAVPEKHRDRFKQIEDQIMIQDGVRTFGKKN